MSDPIDIGSLRRFLAETYGLAKPESVALVSRGSNDTYRVEADGRSFALRLYGRDAYHRIRPDQYRFELELLDHLAKRGAPVAPPVPSREGDLLTCFVRGGKREAALFRWAPGRPHAAWWPEVNEAVVPRLGAGLARLHLDSATLRTTHSRHHFDLDLLLEEPLRLLGAQLESRGRRRELDFFGAHADELRDVVGRLGREGEVYGIIHSDAHVGNVLYDRHEGFTMIDFELCARGWRVYDLVPLLNTLILNVPSVAERVWDLILAGYERVRSLHERERDAIPAFSQLWHLWDMGETLASSSAFGGRVAGPTNRSADDYLSQALSTLHRLSAIELTANSLFRTVSLGTVPALLDG